MARFVCSSEQRFRIGFDKDFDWLRFNTELVQNHCHSRRAIAFDPCFIPKSGKKTEGLGWFWSGCAGSIKRGLEICGIAAIDLENNTALHLEAVQTMSRKSEGQLEFYSRILVERAEQLQQVSNIIVADAYFSKQPFVSALTGAGFEVISLFRSDVVLNYIIEPQKTGKRGRPKVKGEKVDWNDLSKFELESKTDKEIVYSCIVKAKSLKCNVKVVYVKYLDTNTDKIYFSTNTQIQAMEILKIYRTRFQIEFLYRDAKQHTSLNSCQSRSSQKLHNHFNFSLSALNLAKCKHWYSLPKDDRATFSMQNIKTMNHNQLLLNRIIEMFGINPNTNKNRQYIKELISYGTIAA